MVDACELLRIFCCTSPPVCSFELRLEGVRLQILRQSGVWLARDDQLDAKFADSGSHELWHRMLPNLVTRALTVPSGLSIEVVVATSNNMKHSVSWSSTYLRTVNAIACSTRMFDVRRMISRIVSDIFRTCPFRMGARKNFKRGASQVHPMCRFLKEVLSIVSIEHLCC